MGLRTFTTLAVIFTIGVHAGCVDWDKELPQEATGAGDNPAGILRDTGGDL